MLWHVMVNAPLCIVSYPVLVECLPFFIQALDFSCITHLLAMETIFVNTVFLLMH